MKAGRNDNAGGDYNTDGGWLQYCMKLVTILLEAGQNGERTWFEMVVGQAGSYQEVGWLKWWWGLVPVVMEVSNSGDEGWLQWLVRLIIMVMEAGFSDDED